MAPFLFRVYACSARWYDWMQWLSNLVSGMKRMIRVQQVCIMTRDQFQTRAMHQIGSWAGRAIEVRILSLNLGCVALYVLRWLARCWLWLCDNEVTISQ